MGDATDPLPTTIIEVPCHGPYRAVSGRSATIKQADGRPFPLAIQRCTININWDLGEPVTVDLVAIGGFEIDIAAGVRTIEINDRKYRLVEVASAKEGQPCDPTNT